MVRADLKRKTPLSKRLFGWALINILPLGGLAYVGWRIHQGTFSLEDLPSGVSQSAVLAGVAIAALFVVASLLLPLTHRICRWLRGVLVGSREARATGGGVRVVGEMLLWPPRFLAHAVFWLLRIVLIVAAIGLIAVALFFLIRIVSPDLGSDWPYVEEWIGKIVDR